jgi:hypothetical protein
MTKLKVVKNNEKKRLTGRQKKFAELYVNLDLTQTEACRRAGYKSAERQASRFLRDKEFAHVQAYVGELQAENRRKYDITYEKEAKTLHKIRDDAWGEANYSSALQASNLLLKLGGLLVDRKEILHGKVDQMSREEVEKRLQELLEKQQVVSDQ